MATSGKLSNSLTPQAATNPAGTPLVNGTPNLATIGTPGDGKAHLYEIAVTKVVSALETGGAIQVAWTSQGNAFTAVVDPGGRAAGNFVSSLVIVVDPGTSVQVNQSTALTAGASNVVVAIAGG